MTSFVRWLAAAMLAACGLATQAQTIVQPTADLYNNVAGVTSHQGQSFVTTLNGNITAISVRVNVTVTATLRIYTGGQGSGIVGGVGTPIYTQTGNQLIGSTILGPGGGFTTIMLTTPLAVLAGQTYTFMISAPNPFPVAMNSNVNAYPQGTTIVNFGFAQPRDMAFQIFEVATPPAATPAAVPATGEWATLALAAGLAALAASRLPARARRRQPPPKF